MMKKTLILAGVVGAAAVAFAVNSQRVQLVEAADHVDGDVVTQAGNAPADITDLYAWMIDNVGTPEVAMIMAVNPLAAPTAVFPQNVHYAFNIDRGGTASQFICQFESDDNTAVRCWLGDAASSTVISGDPTTELASDGIRVFAGLRKDPFTFNLAGFGTSTGVVNGLDAATLTMLADPLVPGCFDLSGENPAVDDAAGITTLGLALVNCLGTSCDVGPGEAGNAPAVDFFAAFDVLALTATIPVSAIPGTGTEISIYASTHSR